MRTAALLSVLAAIGCAHDGAQLSEANEVRISPEISLVETFGFWERGDDVGRFRLVVAKRCSPEHCFDHAALQWLIFVPVPDGQPNRDAIVESMRLVELGDFAIILSATPVPNSFGSDRLEIRTSNPYTETENFFCVSPTSPGRYTVVEDTCPAAGQPEPDRRSSQHDFTRIPA